MTSPVAGFTSPETFPGKLPFGVFFRRFVPMLVVLTLLALLIAGGLLHGLGAGGLAWPLALVLAAALAVVLIAGKKRQFDQTWGTATLELSPVGATMVSRYSRVQLPWDRVRYLGKADLATAGRFAFGSVLAVLLTQLVTETTRHRGQPALIGLGDTAIAPGTPKVVLGQIRQNTTCRDIDPATGRMLTAIVLTVYDKNWAGGRIGEWIRAYRPDLLSDRVSR